MIRTPPSRRAAEGFNQAIPDGLQQIVNWMMAKDPAGRYPTPERAAQALEVFLAAGSAPPSSPDLDPQMQPYLNWVESESGRIRRCPRPGGADRQTAPMIDRPPARPRPAGKPPSAVPSHGRRAGPLPRKARNATSVEKCGRRRSGGRRRGVAARSRSGGAAALDVELVSLPASGRTPGSAWPQVLTRRDFALFFAGVGAHPGRLTWSAWAWPGCFGGAPTRRNNFCAIDAIPSDAFASPPLPRPASRSTSSVEDGLIASVTPAGDGPVDLSAGWVAPALFDLQINGCDGKASSRRS